jgi:hypothetical protein
MKTGSRSFIRDGLATVIAMLLLAIAACSPRSMPMLSAPTETQSTAVKLVFTTQPVGAAAGTELATQPVVTVLDAEGNLVTGYRPILVLTITEGTCTSEAHLYGGTTLLPANGIFQFSGLSIDKVGSGYTLTATSDSLSAVSAPFDITLGAATELVFTMGPRATAAGVPFPVQPVVVVQDLYGNIATDYNGPVKLSMLYDRASLIGTVVVNAVKGVATFTGLYLNKAGSSYILVASAIGLSTASSSRFDVSPGPAVKLAFTTQPAVAVAGSAFKEQPVVAIIDIYGNPVNSTASVSLVITPDTGTSGAVLSGTATVNATNGEVYFSDLAIDKAGAGYTLTATTSDLPPANSAPFDVISPATKTP